MHRNGSSTPEEFEFLYPQTMFNVSFETGVPVRAGVDRCNFSTSASSKISPPFPSYAAIGSSCHVARCFNSLPNVGVAGISQFVNEWRQLASTLPRNCSRVIAVQASNFHSLIDPGKVRQKVLFERTNSSLEIPKPLRFYVTHCIQYLLPPTYFLYVLSRAMISGVLISILVCMVCTYFALSMILRMFTWEGGTLPSFVQFVNYPFTLPMVYIWPSSWEEVSNGRRVHAHSD